MAIIESVQKGARNVAAGGAQTLGRLQQAFQFNRQLASRQAEAEANRQHQADMQLTQINAASQRHAAGIDASAEQSRFLADEQTKRMIIGAGLQEHASERAFENQLLVARERANEAASRYDQKFTMEQRVADARYASAEQAITNAEWMDDEQREIALAKLQIARTGNSKPTELLGSDPVPPHPSGQEPGVPFQKEDGTWWSIKADGSAMMHSGPQDSVEVQQAQQEYEAQLKQEEREHSAKISAAEARARTRETVAVEVAKFQGKPTKNAKGELAYPTPEDVKRYANTLETYLAPPKPKQYNAPPEIEAKASMVTAFIRSGRMFASLSRDEQGAMKEAAAEVKKWEMQNVR